MEQELNRFLNAISFYKKLNYSLVERIPLFVDLEYINATLPDDKTPFKLQSLNKYLVGSAEQSLLSLVLQNPSKYSDKLMAFSPCFRDDPEDDIHFKHFYKLELFEKITENDYQKLELTINNCLSYFNSFIPCEVISVSDSQYDIIDSKYKIELGSYGIKSYKNLQWIYATGLAEPRLSIVLNKYE